MTRPTLPDITALATGDVVATATYPLSRDTLVRYAGASGDFNPIHYNDTVAESVGLPGVIAHGMLTMGTAIDVVSAWVGDPGRITSYTTRFTKPVVVPATGETPLEVRATVRSVDPATGVVELALDAVADEAGVLGRARVSVQLDGAAS